MKGHEEEVYQMPADGSRLALITGGARRIGAAIAKHLHDIGYNIVIHYRHSEADALQLCQQLNQKREQSAQIRWADFNKPDTVADLVNQLPDTLGDLKLLVNNASSFYPTKLTDVTEADWQDLFDSNVKSAYFLTRQCIPALQAAKGNIINVTDVHAHSPLRNYSAYCCAKASLAMLTRCLAKELAPHVRVNSIAPGTMLWPEDEHHANESLRENIINRNALKRTGTPLDIARAVEFLSEHAQYMTGQTLHVDGGRHLHTY